MYSGLGFQNGRRIRTEIGRYDVKVIESFDDIPDDFQITVLVNPQFWQQLI